MMASSPAFGKATGSLRPLIPARPDRPDRYSRSVTLSGPFSDRPPEPPDTPSNWSHHVHPKGWPYFYGNFQLPVVTNADVYDTKILHCIGLWKTRIIALLADKKLEESDELELFLDISETDCGYYLVDHSARSLLWVEEVSWDQGVFGVASSDQLRLKLTELYWQHIEQFPVHRPVQDIDELKLKSILSQGFADEALGSANSSLPFNGSQCQEFFKILDSRTHSDSPGDPNRMYFIARLWSLIHNHRFSTYNDGEHPRLDRNTPSLWYDDSVPWHSHVAFLAFFNAIIHMLVAMNLPPGLLYAFPGEDKITTSQIWKEYLTFVMDALKVETSYYAPFVVLIVAHFLSDLTNSISLFLLRASLGWILLSMIHSRILLTCCGGMILSCESGRLWRKYARQLGDQLLKPNPLHTLMLPSLCSTIAIINLLLAWLFIFLDPRNENQIESRTSQILLTVNFSIGIASIIAVVFIWRQYLRVRPDIVA